MFILNDTYFLDGNHEQLNPASFISPNYFADEYEYLIAFSHRWQWPLPENIAEVDFLTIRNRIRQLHRIEKRRIAIFYDYSCIYQDKRIENKFAVSTYVALHGSSAPFFKDRDREEKFVEFATLRREWDLKDLYLLMLLADEIYIMQDRYNDYYTRCWCLMETMIGRLCESIVYRTEPSPYGENRDLFQRYERILDDIRSANIFSIKGVQAFQALLDYANCMFESDRKLIKEYVPKIVEKLFAYKWKPATFANDYRYLSELLTGSKREAILWSKGMEQEVLNDIVSRESSRRTSMSTETMSSQYVVTDNELDAILANSDVRDFIEQVVGRLGQTLPVDEIRGHVAQMIRIGLIDVGKKPRD